MISNAEFLLHSSNGNGILNKDASVLNDGNKYETRKQKGNTYTIQYNSAGSLHVFIQDTFCVHAHTCECVCKVNCRSSFHIS
jgi:hypothetical protein